jgi:hypothetical protein
VHILRILPPKADHRNPVLRKRRSTSSELRRFKSRHRCPLCEALLWEKQGRAQKPFKHGGRTRDRTLDLSCEGIRLTK